MEKIQFIFSKKELDFSVLVRKVLDYDSFSTKNTRLYRV